MWEDDKSALYKSIRLIWDAILKICALFGACGIPTTEDADKLKKLLNACEWAGNHEQKVWLNYKVALVESLITFCLRIERYKLFTGLVNLELTTLSPLTSHGFNWWYILNVVIHSTLLWSSWLGHTHVREYLIWMKNMIFVFVMHLNVL